MSKFNIYLNKMDNEVSTLNTYYNRFYEDQEKIYEMGKSVETSWNDNNTPMFLACLDKDNMDILNLHNSVRDYLNEITVFISQLALLLESNSDVGTATQMNYDGNNCISCDSDLVTAINYINAARNTLRYANIHGDAAAAINSAYASLKQVLMDLLNVHSAFENIYKGTEVIINESRARISRVDKYDLSYNGLLYSWDTYAKVANNDDVYNYVEKDINVDLRKAAAHQAEDVKHVDEVEGFVEVEHEMNVDPGIDGLTVTHEDGYADEDAKMKVDPEIEGLKVEHEDEFADQESAMKVENVNEGLSLTKEEEFSGANNEMKVSTNIDQVTLKNENNYDVQTSEFNVNNSVDVALNTAESYTESNGAFDANISIDPTVNNVTSFEASSAEFSNYSNVSVDLSKPNVDLSTLNKEVNIIEQ